MIDALLNLFNVVNVGIFSRLAHILLLIPKHDMTIALISHALKVFLRIIHKIMIRRGNNLKHKKLFLALIFSFKIIGHVPSYVRIFDRVMQDKLKKLRSKNIEFKDIKMVSKIYWSENANKVTFHPVEHLYSESVFQKALFRE